MNWMAGNYNYSKQLERQFAALLGKIARRVNIYFYKYVDKDGFIKDIEGLKKVLADYANKIEPWALKNCERLLKQIEAYNARAFPAILAKNALAKEYVMVAARGLLREQVDLIKSLPLHAAERAQSLAVEQALGGGRAAGIVSKIKESGDVTRNRALLIARTELAKANATFTRARCESSNVTHYIWRTVGDVSVRHTHAELDGKVFAFADPPFIAGEGAHHPGEFPNCRCYAEPILK